MLICQVLPFGTFCKWLHARTRLLAKDRVIFWQAMETYPAKTWAVQEVIGYLRVIGIGPGINDVVVAVFLLDLEPKSATLRSALLL